MANNIICKVGGGAYPVQCRTGGGMAVSQYSKEILYKDYTYTNLAITTKSGGGVYYSSPQGIGLQGYSAVGVSVSSWQGMAASVMPYLRPSTNEIAFGSDISITVSSLQARVIYMKN